MSLLFLTECFIYIFFDSFSSFFIFYECITTSLDSSIVFYNGSFWCNSRIFLNFCYFATIDLSRDSGCRESCWEREDSSKKYDDKFHDEFEIIFWDRWFRVAWYLNRDVWILFDYAIFLVFSHFHIMIESTNIVMMITVHMAQSGQNTPTINSW